MKTSHKIPFQFVFERTRIVGVLFGQTKYSAVRAKISKVKNFLFSLITEEVILMFENNKWENAITENISTLRGHPVDTTTIDICYNLTKSCNFIISWVLWLCQGSLVDNVTLAVWWCKMKLFQSLRASIEDVSYDPAGRQK